MITYNNPKDTERRSNVVPLSLEDMEYSAYFLNKLFAIFELHLEKNPTGVKENYDKEYDLIQRIFDHHANLQHLYDNAGGWEGLAKLQETADSKGWISVDERLPKEGDYNVTDGKNVTSAYYDHYGKWNAPSEVSPTYEMSSVSLDIKVTHWQPLPSPPTE